MLISPRRIKLAAISANAAVPAAAIGILYAADSLYGLLVLRPVADDSLYGLVYLALAVVMTPGLVATLIGSIVMAFRQTLTPNAVSVATTIPAVFTLTGLALGLYILYGADNSTYTPASVDAYQSAMLIPVALAGITAVAAGGATVYLHRLAHAGSIGATAPQQLPETATST